MRLTGDAVPRAPWDLSLLGLLQQKGFGRRASGEARLPFCCLQTLQSALRLRPRRAVSSAGVNQRSQLCGVFPVSVTVGLYREQGLGKSGSIERSV